MASVVVAEPVAGGVAALVGQGAKVQLGPVRPTAEPSGQSIASAGHAVPPVLGVPGVRTFRMPMATAITSITAAMTTYFFIS